MYLLVDFGVISYKINAGCCLLVGSMELRTSTYLAVPLTEVDVKWNGMPVVLANYIT